MRYYLASCEYKWSHARTNAENIWIMKELGQRLYNQCHKPGSKLVLLRSNSQTLPEDIYCRCDIYVDVDSSSQGLLFALQGHKQIQEEQQ